MIFTVASFYVTFLAALILTLLGVAYALYHVSVLSLSMELIPEGKAGLFDVLVSLGGAGGALIGPLTAQVFGFVWVFFLSSAIFLFAYMAFKVFS